MISDLICPGLSRVRTSAVPYLIEAPRSHVTRLTPRPMPVRVETPAVLQQPGGPIWDWQRDIELC